MNYKCQCKCGKVHYINGTTLLRKKSRDCGDDCAIKQERIKKRLASYPRVKDKSYDIRSLRCSFPIAGNALGMNLNSSNYLKLLTIVFLIFMLFRLKRLLSDTLYSTVKDLSRLHE